MSMRVGSLVPLESVPSMEPAAAGAPGAAEAPGAAGALGAAVTPPAGDAPDDGAEGIGVGGFGGGAASLHEVMPDATIAAISAAPSRIAPPAARRGRTCSFVCHCVCAALACRLVPGCPFMAVA